MSIAAIVTRGYGTFGSIAEVVTRGYTSGEVDLTTGVAPGCRLVALAEAIRLRAQPEGSRIVATPGVRH